MKTPFLQCRLFFFFISSCLLLQIIISVGGFISISMVAAQAQSQCLTHQKMLLLQFRSSLVFDSTASTKLARWNYSTDDNCCVWPGVECDTSGHVISLILDKEAITDGIHNSSALFSLQYLERLNLAFNNFNFKPIPVQIYNLTNLKYLNLSRAGFGGQIPNGISRLTRLVTLDLSIDSNYDFNLEIPNLNQFFENSTQLRQLYLDGVDLSSTVVIPKFLANFSNLKTLSLDHCYLQGSFPREIFLIHGLQELNLHSNDDLSGSFPSFPGSLRMILVSGTQFSGSLPASISNLTNLSKIDLSYCNFSGSIPSTMAQLTSLTYVDFSHNHFTGSIPNLILSKNLTRIAFSWNGLTGPLSSKHFEGLSKIQYIDLQSNYISGRIPTSLFSLPTLQWLYLSNNSFHGVVDEYVNVSTTQLETLDLSSNRLNESFPKYFSEFSKLRELLLSSNSLGGRIQSFLFSLPSLELLDLSNNSFDGLVDEYVNVSVVSQLDALYLSSNRLNKSFPKYFFEFPKLSILLLSSNSLGGKIQSSMFSLPSLQTLDLSNNLFDGLSDEYVNVSTSQLKSLNLSSNRLNGPFPKYFFEFPKLWDLLLSSNSLGGKIQSSIFSLPSLQWLDLSNNSFDGLVDEYVNVSVVSQLYRLDLRSNNLNKPFPKYFFEFPQLSDLDISSNSLGGWIMFQGLQKLTNLNVLDLSNNKIRGEIPSWIWELGNGTLVFLNLSCNFLESLEKPYTISSSLTIIDLHSNQLQGLLPNPLAYNNCVGPFHLDYSHNFFNGSIPFGLWSFARNVVFLSLANNSFTGTISESICNASSLEILDLSDNKLGGTLPSCLFNSFNRFGVLNLRNNQIHGSVPDSFTINCSLQTLDLSRNSFEGKIPKSLINCSLLEVLNVGSNNIVDTFPCALKNLSSLRVLVLRSNNFHGDLHCVNANHMWPNLQIIDIASNNFSGILSPKFLNWKRMIIDEDTAQSGQYIMFHHIEVNGEYDPYDAHEYYQDILMVTWKGMEMEMVKILKVFTFVDFSCNNFYGVIPESIGVLTSLYVLNLSHNGLVGNIPETIGNLKMIESLDLSANQLCGEIPTQLAKLTFLSVMNLSFNRLSGMIPTGNQLNTFGPDSYIGNQELCGFPLPKSCKSPKTSNGGRSEIEFDGGSSEIKWEYVSSAMGFAVGLGAYLWMLLHNKRCWEAYQQLDEVLIRLFGPRRRGRKSPHKIFI